MVTVEPLYENGTFCSQKALLITESTQPIRLGSVILAREIGMLRENMLCNSNMMSRGETHEVGIPYWVRVPDFGFRVGMGVGGVD